MGGSQAHTLKVLLVSYWFPPTNIIGAVRVGKLAKYLYQVGHDVRVVATSGPGDNSLPLEIPSEQVIYTVGWSVDRFIDSLTTLARRGRKRPSDAKTETGVSVHGEGALPRRSLRRMVAKHCYALLYMPDAQSGWIGAATAAGKKIAQQWRPDVVVASAPPYSSFVAARRIARCLGAPWVADLRDPWVDDPYCEDPLWRRWVDRILERYILSSAAGLVTATPIYSQNLRRRYRQPIATVLNGFAEEDFPADRCEPPLSDDLVILYTGHIYVGYRDPTPLFEAINLLGARRERVSVHFYGTSVNEIHGLAVARGLGSRINVHDRVSYHESLSLQARADVLLLLQWNDKRDEGNIPGKFFEYLGARRPILLLGYEQGILAQMIREREAGFVSNDPVAIAVQLQNWIAQKRARIPPIDAKAREGMSRTEQFRALERFLVTDVLSK